MTTKSHRQQRDLRHRRQMRVQEQKLGKLVVQALRERRRRAAEAEDGRVKDKVRDVD